MEGAFEVTLVFDIMILITRAFLNEFLEQTNPKVKLIVLSNMNQESYQEFKRFSKEIIAGIDPNHLPVVEIMNPIPHSKLPSLYKSVDAFIRISHSEEWPKPNPAQYHLPTMIPSPCLDLDHHEKFHA